MREEGEELETVVISNFGFAKNKKIRKLLKKGNKIVLLLNRPWVFFSRHVSDCGFVCTLFYCDISLTCIWYTKHEVHYWRA